MIEDCGDDSALEEDLGGGNSILMIYSISLPQNLCESLKAII